MNKKQSLLALMVPSLGVLLMVWWSLGRPLLDHFPFGSFMDYPRAVMAAHAQVMLFGTEAGVWVVFALACFGTGVWLVLKAVHDAEARIAQRFGFVLACVPLVMIGLALLLAVPCVP